MHTVEHWVLTTAGLMRIYGINQLFVKRNSADRIILIVAKLSDDFLVCGKLSDVNKFLREIQKRFEGGKIGMGLTFHFGGCEINYDPNGDIILGIEAYWNRVKSIAMTRTRRRQHKFRVTTEEMHEYRSLAGTLLYLGNGVLSHASMVVSIMQQQIGRLRVEHLIDANMMLAELRKLGPFILLKTYNQPK